MSQTQRLRNRWKIPHQGPNLHLTPPFLLLSWDQGWRGREDTSSSLLGPFSPLCRMHSSQGLREGQFSEYPSSPERKLSQGKACRRVSCILCGVSARHINQQVAPLTAAWKVLHEGRPKIKVLGPKHSLSQRWQLLVLLSRLEGGVSPLNCWPPVAIKATFWKL